VLNGLSLKLLPYRFARTVKLGGKEVLQVSFDGENWMNAEIRDMGTYSSGQADCESSCIFSLQFKLKR
jgi:hypothetical protein